MNRLAISRNVLLPAAGLAMLLGGLRAETPATRPGTAAPSPPITYLAPRQIAKIACKQINESSGLACGRRNKDVFWTHNDSGDGPRLFAFDRKGRRLATVTLKGALATDWEDMASFTARGKHILLVGDVGDNYSKRKSCTLYAVAEPKLNTQRPAATGKLPVAQTICFSYEGGPRNCESLAVDPTTLNIYLVSKEGGKCGVYELSWPKKTVSRQVARRIAVLKIAPATAMDISPDGLRAVVLTYGPAFEYVRGKKEKWADAFARKPRRINMPRRRQGESICYGRDGKTLYLTSEFTPSPLWEVPVKGATTAPATKPKPAGDKAKAPPASGV